MMTELNPKSFHDLILNHPTVLVNPLQWTSRHLDLVGCRFEDAATISAGPEAVPTDNTNGGIRSRYLEHLSDAELIATNPFPAIKRRHLTNLLVHKTGNFTDPRNGPSFHFQGRPTHRPRYLMFRGREGLNDVDDIHHGSPMVVGYVHYTSVNGDRRRQFEPCPGPMGTINHVGASICQKRLFQTSPKEWTEDPYFVCHLIALAQYQARKSDSPRPPVFTPRLLVTNVLDQRSMLLYEADITSDLLRGLEYPRHTTCAMAWPVIRRKRVTYKPYDTFASRLVAELATSSPSASFHHSSQLLHMGGELRDGGKRAHESDVVGRNRRLKPSILEGENEEGKFLHPQ
ncbi:hypothetical protein BDV25DRAFT_127559 [Aspergillus avenaceus]|uniref:Uncharacterized protein n=1 Tax=Aspergillus avenaceus TaxID=36643 RepID=A0A5N6U2Y3_ASPAV|nr:hypothetical protein BDV25DRAFT_127559 [Aspergillus avenaceus]